MNTQQTKYRLVQIRSEWIVSAICHSQFGSTRIQFMPTCTKNVSRISQEEYRSQLDQFLQDEVTVTELLAEESQLDADLREAVIALARRNVKQRVRAARHKLNPI